MLVCSHVPSHPHLVPGTPVHSISTSENNSFVQLNSARQLKGFFVSRTSGRTRRILALCSQFPGLSGSFLHIDSLRRHTNQEVSRVWIGYIRII